MDTSNDRRGGHVIPNSKVASLVRESVEQRLTSDGWHLLDADIWDKRGNPFRQLLAVPLSTEFAATVGVSPRIVAESGDHGPILGVAARLGLDYTPARALTQALVGRAISGIVLKEPSRLVELADENEIARAADMLVAFAEEARRGPLHERAEVDVMVEMISEQRATPAVMPREAVDGQHRTDVDEELELVIALLAAASRYDEADRALRSAGPSMSLESRRAIRQLRRWVDARGDLALPTSPASWGSSKSRLQDHQARKGARGEPARQEAIEIARAHSQVTNRDDLHLIVATELARRRVAIDPGDLDRCLDLLMLKQKPFGNARMAMLGLKALRRMTSPTPRGLGPLESFVDSPAERSAVPDVDTPERAGYPIYVTQGRVTVTLAADAHAVLENLAQANNVDVHEAIDVRVWLSNGGSADEGLEVHLGPSLVGHIDHDAGNAFQPPIAAAAERDEVPWAYAEIVRRPSIPAYALYLELPAEKAAL